MSLLKRMRHMLPKGWDSVLDYCFHKIRRKKKKIRIREYSISAGAITRSVIVRYILPSAQSQKCLFLDLDFPRKAVTMMTATKAKVWRNKISHCTTPFVCFAEKRKSKNRHFCDCADGQTQYGRITLLVMAPDGTKYTQQHQLK